VGSAVNGFGGRCTLSIGDKYFVAETCEYRRHFLSFHPKTIILISVESDHQDYYPRYEDIRDAFIEYGRLLPPDGDFIFCADDPGASEVAAVLKKEKPEINLVPYGFSSQNDYRIESYQVLNERVVISLKGFPGELKIRIPGRHTALNTAAAVALCSLLVKKEFGNEGNNGWNEERREGVRKALEEFSGSKRRSEILGEAGGILFMDDYGHHPTAIRATLKGLKEFYPRRRIVISFMSHTFTRTASLFDEFASCFTDADLILLHKIYASAREVYNGGVTGRTLFEKTKENYGKRVIYAEEVDDGFELMKGILKGGDLFITMGAGDNWRLGKKLYEFYKNEFAKNEFNKKENGNSQ
jgi:UDP-N-acetylmuramate--alanine ligase